MSLIKYNIDTRDKYIFVNNIDLLSFLNFLGKEISIEILEFYGHNDVGSITTEQFHSITTIRSLITYIIGARQLRINSLVFRTGKNRFEIIDGYEYHITSNSIDAKEITETLFRIFNELMEANHFLPSIKLYQDTYLLFNNGQLIRTFNKFDDYIASDLE